MARIDNEIRTTPSILDRLIDLEPKSSQEAPKHLSTSLLELKASVRRDLEWLLNTRSHAEDIDEKLVEIKKSVVNYGLPDFTGISAKNHHEQRRMTEAISNAIRYFEPRFIDLKVTLEPINYNFRELRFKIEAKLDIDPAPEQIAFDTVLELGSGQFEIKES